MNETSVSLIIPNWNGKLLLEQHLRNTINFSGNAEIILVDDHSDDDSVNYVKSSFPEVIVVEKPYHEGFASTVNAGVSCAHGDIVILLNTDVEPEKGYLSSLIRHFSDPLVFAVGCLDRSLENGQIISRGRGIGYWHHGFYLHKRGEVDKTDTAWVSGGSGAFRRSMWQKLKGMDPIFNPFYWEDIDLSYRAVQAGYRILFEPKSIVHHYHEAGKIKRTFTANQVRQIAFRNQFFFVWKHLPNLRQLLLHIIFTPYMIIRMSLRGDLFMLKGLLMAFLYIPKIIRYRMGK
jgi:GT2 family glycosyltransferase